jgi:phosphate:Na+ symporter
MVSALATLAGGIGLFLLGMALLSDGLRAFAGDDLRRRLLELTGKPWRAFLSGAVATALVQSSSATTVAMIGFVSAGLVSFPQAIGVLLGASLGTTATGWIVAGLGLKFSAAYLGLPVIGAGAFVRTFSPGRWKQLGQAAGGFGMIFVGIGTLQQAMAGAPRYVELGAPPADTLWHRVLLVVVGVFLTVLLQSSSAAMAMTLTALHSGSIHFEQAAVLSIGASIGTTVTGVIASIGASVPAKRTALSLVLLNAVTGAVALLLLPALLAVVGWAQRTLELEPGAMSLAAFHTAFVGLGALLLLPFLDRIAVVVERWLPEKRNPWTAHFDASVLAAPEAALETTRRSLAEITAAMCQEILKVLGTGRPAASVAALHQALGEAQHFYEKIPELGGGAGSAELRAALLHAFDHVTRLDAAFPPSPRLLRALDHEPARAMREELCALLRLAADGLTGRGPAGWTEQVAAAAQRIKKLNRAGRASALQQASLGQRSAQDALDTLDAMRWINRLAERVDRACHYLAAHPATAILTA